MSNKKYKKNYEDYKKKYLHLKRQVFSNYDYDLIIIGGGSGGIAAAIEASKFGIKIALFDYVKPSALGNKWGLGGTCVNVGCIPKKLFYYSSQIGEIINRESKEFGWNLTSNGDISNNWNLLVNNVQSYIKSLNNDYELLLKNNKIEYFNLSVKFINEHKIQGTNHDGKNTFFTSNKFIIATGGRPKYPNIPGAKEFGITTDDLFSLKNSPGKTLIVGGGYVAIECASFLKSFGYDIILMARSDILKKFDKGMIDLLISNLDLTFLKRASPIKVELLDSNTKRVYYELDTGENNFLDVDTVIWAIGRKPQINNLDLEKIGVKIDEKIITTNEQTNIKNIFAIGDIIKDGIELTPVAIKAAKLLIERLYGSCEKFMDYSKIPTSIFTVPIEYASIGLTEEKAIDIYGIDNIEIYHTYMDPVHFKIIKKINSSYIKLICHKKENLGSFRGEKIIGIHIMCPNASEIIQGYVVAFNMGASKHDLDMTIGIHPTLSENLFNLNITKASGLSPNKKQC